MYPYRWGLGDASITAPSAQQMTSAISLGLQTANSTGNATAGAIAGGLSAASAATVAFPPVSAVFAIGAALTGIITKIGQGCGQTCIAASDAANSAEPLLVQNVLNYTSTPVRTRSFQLQALANFDNIFNALVQKCQQIGGGGGTNCVKDRVAGACHWKASPWRWDKQPDGSYTFTPAGPNGSGNTCWNWVYGYRDSIASDPGVVADSYTSSSTADAVLGVGGSVNIGGTSIPTEYLLLGAVALLVAVSL